MPGKEDIKGSNSSKIEEKVKSGFSSYQTFLNSVYKSNKCIRIKVNGLYNEFFTENDTSKNIGASDDNPTAAKKVFSDNSTYIKSKDFYRQCLENEEAQKKSEKPKDSQSNSKSVESESTAKESDYSSPFDRRLDKLVEGTGIAIVPYDTRFRNAGTSGHTISMESVQKSGIKNSNDIALSVAKNQLEMSKDPFYQGVASVINSYSLTKLYGSIGGQYLVDRKGERKWYEIDETNEGRLNYSKNPTTTSIINWGEGDPYGRTPYHYGDFAFCKYWNIIPNNRMITLRRYAAPIVDNLKFPGMDGFNDVKNSSPDKNSDKSKDKSKKTNDPTLGQNIENTGEAKKNNEETGSGKKIDFSPMATAITYFGEGTENRLSDILKFTTGLEWEDATSDVFEVGMNSNPDSEAGPAGISDSLYGGLNKMSKMLNIATGKFDSNAILNGGELPPDPYKDGPYENRIIGPVNAITSVKKRKRGLKYENSIPLNFEYVARPIGGINTKAILLDIISNFLIIGSASAMFWGGQHRFMSQPQRYPFMGGDKGIQQWYNGDPLGWGETTVKSIGGQVAGKGGLMDLIGGFMSSLLGGGDKGDGKGNILKDGLVGNVIKHTAVSKSQGSIPYLTGLRALLIGEPVGEWHVTIGNPLNPIAMIGNLICESMVVEFGNELGPDDFPLDVKISVNLSHGMPRDRDAIQSMFNRGMGRIYDLPDNFKGTADYETAVDKNSGNKSDTGWSPNNRRAGNIVGGAASSGGKIGPSATKDLAVHGNISVWTPVKFSAPSPNQPFFNANTIETRSQFRAATWITQKANQ